MSAAHPRAIIQAFPLHENHVEAVAGKPFEGIEAELEGLESYAYRRPQGAASK